MPEAFVINGKKPLKGKVKIGGYKNAAGPILAAALLTKEDCLISNLPLVDDVLNFIKVLESLGVKIEKIGEREIKISPGNNISPEKMDFRAIGKMRLSVLLIGPLLALFKDFKIPPPGGDKIGLRPISTHLQALLKMGASIVKNGAFYYFHRDILKGCEVVLGEFSVTATENLMLAAVKAKGKTVIKMAASEPQVQDLGKMLILMGAKIKGLGTHTIEIEGATELKGAEHKVAADPLEAGTFVVAGAAAKGELEVENAPVEFLDAFLQKMEEIGVEFEKGKDFVRVKYCQDPKPVKVQALPYPGFSTDLLPVIVPLLTRSQGKSLIHDPMYDDRLGYIHELRKMKADIDIVDPHRAFIWGRTDLSGIKISSWDIRAGAALIIAGLMAEGETVIENISQIDRGYEKIEEKLAGAGADIKRVNFEN